MNIKKIHMCSMGKEHFFSECAVVEADNGKFYQYTFDISSTWKDREDYFDNVRSDFENESDNENFAQSDWELFWEIKNDSDLEYWHEDWLKDAVRKAG